MGLCFIFLFLLSSSSHHHAPSRESSSSSFCTSISDRLTVYDSRTPDKTTIIDVLCYSRTTHKKIVSSGPSLLIEFESSSNRTAMGFSAKYRFSELPDGEWVCGGWIVGSLGNGLYLSPMWFEKLIKNDIYFDEFSCLLPMIFIFKDKI